MLRTVEALVEPDGNVTLLEDIALAGTRRAIVTIFDEPAEEGLSLTALLSEPALSDWSREEEDAAWAHLQQER